MMSSGWPPWPSPLTMLSTSGEFETYLPLPGRVADVDGLPAPGLRLLLAEPGPADACGQAGEQADEHENGGSPHRLHESTSTG